MMKSVYRYPIMIGMPKFYEHVSPKSMRDNVRFHKFCTGISLAIFEVLVLCPFERIKIYFMTANNRQSDQEVLQKESFRSYYRNAKSSGLVRDLYKGLGSLLFR